MSTHTAPDSPSVRIVQPPNRLKSKVGRGSPTLPPTVPPTFRALVHASAAAYSRHLDDQLHALRALATGGGAAATETLFAIAHQIRGEAKTFGFGSVGGTAESLCAFIEAGGPGRARGGTVVTLHVDTMAALKADCDARGETAGAQPLLDGLARAVRHVLSPERA
ncbi:Hpt domain-containing protein [Azospirillum sp. TSO22-1]|uniref:Hpt domain-containing protein n=1 Tax=Azospirillum sp. TSO22-1 TaxID=716789 RepID=UPI000D61705A|nr:Hpt domain-containing protein [Azospirillum sp. TSO22-1]PWC53400.1 hypothetical protein TSO221_10760 [Azospirillum sp. TSO22-1]